MAFHTSTCTTIICMINEVLIISEMNVLSKPGAAQQGSPEEVPIIPWRPSLLDLPTETIEHILEVREDTHNKNFRTTKVWLTGWFKSLEMV